MPTAVSSTEVPVTRGSAVATALGDLLTLLRFRARTARRGRARGAIAAFVVLTAAVAIVPAWMPHAGSGERAFNLLLLLPTGMAGVLLLAITSAVASGGGRELMPRDPGQIFPIGSTTDGKVVGTMTGTVVVGGDVVVVLSGPVLSDSVLCGTALC